MPAFFAVEWIVSGQVEFCRSALSRETPKSAQRQFKIAGALFDGVVQVAEIAPIPHLHGTPVP